MDMSSSDVLVEHIALKNFLTPPSAPMENIFVEAGHEPIFYSNAGQFRGYGQPSTDNAMSFEQSQLGRSAAHQLQSFEHSFGWIRNVSPYDLDLAYQGFLSLHGTPQNGEMSCQDMSNATLMAPGTYQTGASQIIPAIDQIVPVVDPIGSVVDQTGSAAGQGFSSASHSKSGAAQRGPIVWNPYSQNEVHQQEQQRATEGERERREVKSADVWSSMSSPSGSSDYSGSLHIASNLGDDYQPSYNRTRHHSEPNVFLGMRGQRGSCPTLTGNDLGEVDGLPRSHSEALLALPVFKQESLETGFQYILSAATSPASKMNEETVTYLNQGQPYELKLKKYGDFTEIKGRSIKSIVRVVFHDRRLQYMEREQLELWKRTRPGERILDIDIPLSYAVQNVKVEPNKLNSVEFTWDPAKDTGIFVKVNSISTEFTAKKHGGEKGVPFRIQVETYVPDDADYYLAHCASCQVKVFKPKGADRKHKTDREKMERRSEAEKEKYQPSYECTVLAEIPLEQAFQYLDNLNQQALQMESDNSLLGESPYKQGRSSTSTPKHQRAGSDISDNSEKPFTPKQECGSPPLRNFQYITDSSSSEARADLPKNASWGSFTSAGEASAVNSWVPKIEAKKPDAPAAQLSTLSPTAKAGQVSNWLKTNRFAGYVSTFSNFSGADLLRLSRDDLIQICGVADGIRLDNALQSKMVRPRLTIYVCQGNHCVSPCSQPSSLPSTTASVVTSGSAPGVPSLPCVLPIPQTAPVSKGGPVQPSLHSAWSFPPSSFARDAAVYTDLTYNTPGPHNHLLFGSPPGALHNQPYAINGKLDMSTSARQNQPEKDSEHTKPHLLSFRKGKSRYSYPGTRRSDPANKKYIDAGPYVQGNIYWKPNVGAAEATSGNLNGQHSYEMKHCSCNKSRFSAGAGCNCRDEVNWSMSHGPGLGEESQQSLLSFLFAGEGDWADQNAGGRYGSSSTEWACLIQAGTKKVDSQVPVGSPEVPANGGKPVAAPTGPVRQTSPSGVPQPKAAPCKQEAGGAGDMCKTGPSPSPSSGHSATGQLSTGTGSSAVPPKYKRQLVEDLDSYDQDEEKIVTSTKKQRTRPLELSRKEVFHAVFMEQLGVDDLIEKFADLFSVSVKQIVEIYLVGPNDINILVTDSVVQNFKDQSRFALEATLVDNTHDRYKLHMQPME